MVVFAPYVPVVLSQRLNGILRLEIIQRVKSSSFFVILKKIYFYYLYSNFLYNYRSREQIKNELDDLIKHLIQEFYQPEIYGFKPRPT